MWFYIILLALLCNIFLCKTKFSRVLAYFLYVLRLIIIEALRKVTVKLKFKVLLIFWDNEKKIVSTVYFYTTEINKEYRHVEPSNSICIRLSKYKKLIFKIILKRNNNLFFIIILVIYFILLHNVYFLIKL